MSTGWLAQPSAADARTDAGNTGCAVGFGIAVCIGPCHKCIAHPADRRRRRRREREAEAVYAKQLEDLPLEDIAKEMQDSWQLKVPTAALVSATCKKVVHVSACRLHLQ